mgnify:CR=1 FL=1
MIVRSAPTTPRRRAAALAAAIAVIAVGIGLWVLPRTWTLLKASVNVLMEGVPDGVDWPPNLQSVDNLLTCFDSPFGWAIVGYCGEEAEG